MLNDTTNWQDWVNNPPSNTWPSSTIGNSKFNGTFDGNGFIISGIYINASRYYVGLFESVEEEGKIRNLGVIASCIKGGTYIGGLVGINHSDSINDSYFVGIVTGGSYVGGLVGYNRGGSIRGYSIATVTGSRRYIGGIVGHNEGIISDSYSIGTTTGTGIEFLDGSVGGLVGYNKGTISSSYSIGSVIGSGGAINGTTSGAGDNIGGLVGGNEGLISNSYSTCAVKGLADCTGGLVGDNNYSGIINNSFSTGTVMGEYQTGGLIGCNRSIRSSTGIVSNSYSTSRVSGKSMVGGFAGYNVGTINNSYSIGRVTGNNYVKGLIGNNPGNINNGYYDMETSGQNDTVGNSKYTTEMKQQSTFANWNFNEIWGINVAINSGYPYLQWSEDMLCLEAGHVYTDGVCKTAEQIVCEVTEGMIWENGTCKTIEQLACEAIEGMVWENGNCVTPIRLPQITNGQIIVQVTNDGIVLENLPHNSKIEVYNLHGKRIYLGNPENSKILKIMVQTKGIYIVKAGMQTFRVAVR
jgi:hypothetical protein